MTPAEIERMKKYAPPPLQNMQPVDPSYGDLFKKLRPY